MVCLVFWTAGVDVRTRAQFKWDNTGEAINPTLRIANFLGPYTCLLFFVNDTLSNLDTYSCSTESFYTLCENVPTGDL